MLYSVVRKYAPKVCPPSNETDFFALKMREIISTLGDGNKNPRRGEGGAICYNVVLKFAPSVFPPSNVTAPFAPKQCETRSKPGSGNKTS